MLNISFFTIRQHTSIPMGISMPVFTSVSTSLSSVNCWSINDQVHIQELTKSKICLALTELFCNFQLISIILSWHWFSISCYQLKNFYFQSTRYSSIKYEQYSIAWFSLVTLVHAKITSFPPISIEVPFSETANKMKIIALLHWLLTPCLNTYIYIYQLNQYTSK